MLDSIIALHVHLHILGKYSLLIKLISLVQGHAMHTVFCNHHLVYR